jgi:hypothetical protein
MARGALWWAFATLLAACGSKESSPTQPLAEATCADHPGSLPRPPTRGLPCELLPPGKQR